MRRALDGAAAESVESNNQPQRRLSDALRVKPGGRADGVDIEELRKWQTRAVAAEQSVREAQASMVSASRLHLYRVFQLTCRQLQQHSNFVLALVNGNEHIVSFKCQTSTLHDWAPDNIKFSHKLLLKGADGGGEAADVLLDEIKSRMQIWAGADSWKILARVYINVEGLLCKSGELSKCVGPWEITAFAQGFSQRQPLFDFVDVGNDFAVGQKLGGKSISACF